MLDNHGGISKAHLAAGRAVDQLRRQLGIVLQEDNGSQLGVCPVEGLTTELLARLSALPHKKLYLLLTGARARHFGLNAHNMNAIRIEAKNLTLAALLALADPLSGKSAPDVVFEHATPAQELLLTMARYASLLPALLAIEGDVFPQDWLNVLAADVNAYWAAPPLDIVELAHVRLPIEGTENAKLFCFRTRYGTSTHLAMVFGDISKDPIPLTRIHSSCITGDILGSLRCDCGDQLQLALEQLQKSESGILLYLHQEGRGIGIANKLRAYQLQEQGYDTYDANLALGFEEDERDFGIAAAILKKLGVQKIKLLTNNPRKISAMEKSGISIQERMPLIIKPGEHNHAYLQAKEKKAGHLF